MKIILYIHLFSALLFSFSVSANNTVESETLIPILLTKFYPPSVAGSDHAAEQSSLSKNIEIDLKNKGGYTFLDHPFEKYFYSKTFNNGVVEDNSEKYTAWNNAGLEYVATARLRNAKGGYKVEFQLLDVHEKKQIFAVDYSVKKIDEIGMLGHEIADLIHERMSVHTDVKTFEPGSISMNSTPDIKLTEDQVLAKIRIQQKKAKTLLTRWDLYIGSSPFDQLEFKSEVAGFVRDDARVSLTEIVDEVLSRLKILSLDKPNEYKRVETKLAKPTRLLLDDILFLWNVAFQSDKKKNIEYYYDSEAGGSASASAFSDYPFLLNSLLEYQYELSNQQEINMIASKDQKLSANISSSKTNYKYAKPDRWHERLHTPSELFFGNIGAQAGSAAAGMISYASQLKELERNIIESRRLLFDCYPTCNNLSEKKSNLLKFLTEKDLYLLKLSGRSGLLVDGTTPGFSAVVELVGGQQGSSIIDNGIPERCKNPFQSWINLFANSIDVSKGKQMEQAFSILLRFGNGDFMGVANDKNVDSQEAIRQRAFVKSGELYRKYQFCRDQWEFDYGEKL